MVKAILISDSNEGTPVNVVVLVLLGEDLATKLAEQTSETVIVNKVRDHVLKTGSAGLAGTIREALGDTY